MDSMEILHENINTARNFTPMSQLQIDELIAHSEAYSTDGMHESYKTYEMEDPEEEGEED